MPSGTTIDTAIGPVRCDHWRHQSVISVGGIRQSGEQTFYHVIRLPEGWWKAPQLADGERGWAGRFVANLGYSLNEWIFEVGHTYRVHSDGDYGVPPEYRIGIFTFNDDDAIVEFGATPHLTDPDDICRVIQRAYDETMYEMTSAPEYRDDERFPHRGEGARG